MPTVSGRDGSCLVCDTSEAPCELNSECICRESGDTCYKDYGILYDIWLAVFFVIFFYEFAYAFRVTYKSFLERQERKRSGKKDAGHFTPLDKILCLSTVGNFIRCVWIISIIPGRSTEDVMFGGLGDAVLLKLPQVLWQSGFLYLALVWKRLLDQLETMKKNNRKEAKAEEHKVNIASLVFCVVCIPLSFLGQTVNANLTKVLNLIQLFSGCVLIYKAKKFGRELAGKMKHIPKAATLVTTIRQTIDMAIIATVVLFLSIFVNFYGMEHWGAPWMYALWVLVHGGEVALAHALMLTKRAQENKKIATAKFSERDTTKASTMASNAASSFNTHIDHETGDATL